MIPIQYAVILKSNDVEVLTQLFHYFDEAEKEANRLNKSDSWEIRDPANRAIIYDYCETCAEVVRDYPHQCEVQPKPGLRFLHARQITRTSSPRSPGGSVPEECVVTAVRNGMVYYRNSTGFLSKVSQEKFSGVVKEVL